MPEAAPILQTVDLTRHFGMVTAADGLNVEVGRGELMGIVGANGSGKTTFLNLITGYLKPERGHILFMGRETTGLPPRAITKLGVARSFQIPQLYTHLSVLESMLLSLAAESGNGTGFWRSLYQERWKAEGLETLERFGLESYAERPVSELPEGGRKLLDIALSFALKPQLLLMDEPTSGVSIEDKFQVMDTLVNVLRQSDITTIFVEHDMEVVQRYGRRVLVFDEGRVIADGKPESVLADPEVRKAVLGRV
ncbi:MAG: ABC transporter ATP-binding protein [Candidatus Methylomirabilia bacterium]